MLQLDWGGGFPVVLLVKSRCCLVLNLHVFQIGSRDLGGSASSFTWSQDDNGWMRRRKDCNSGNLLRASMHM